MLVGGVSNLRAACPASWIYLDILLFHSGYLYRELSGVGARRYCQSEFHTWCGSQFSITRRRQDVCPLCYFLIIFFCNILQQTFFGSHCHSRYHYHDAIQVPKKCAILSFMSQAKCGRVRSKRWYSLTICPSLSQCSGSLWKIWWIWDLIFKMLQVMISIDLWFHLTYLTYLTWVLKKKPKVWLIFFTWAYDVG